MSALLVAAQFVLIFLICIRPSEAQLSLSVAMMTGLLMMVCAGLVAFWAFLSMRRSTFSVMPEPVQNGELCQSGPYRFIRHPMYSSVLLGCAGVALCYQTPIKWLLLLLLLIVLITKLKREEKLLQHHYSQYSKYMLNTKALIPHVY